MLLVTKLIIFLPLISGIFNGVFCKKLSNNQASFTAIIPIILSAVCASYVFVVAGINKETIHIIITKWINIELMLLAVNINFVAFSVYLQDIVGQVFSLIILSIAAAEISIGLAILVLYFRNRGSIEIEDVNQMKG